jgi:hypothetical protein
MAIHEVVKEIKLIYFLLQDKGFDVELPIVVIINNIGTLFMSQNALSCVHNRHVNTGYHFI